MPESEKQKQSPAPEKKTETTPLMEKLCRGLPPPPWLGQLNQLRGRNDAEARRVFQNVLTEESRMITHDLENTKAQLKEGVFSDKPRTAIEAAIRSLTYRASQIKSLQRMIAEHPTDALKFEFAKAEFLWNKIKELREKTGRGLEQPGQKAFTEAYERYKKEAEKGQPTPKEQEALRRSEEKRTELNRKIAALRYKIDDYNRQPHHVQAWRRLKGEKKRIEQEAYRLAREKEQLDHEDKNLKPIRERSRQLEREQKELLQRYQNMEVYMTAYCHKLYALHHYEDAHRNIRRELSQKDTLQLNDLADTASKETLRKSLELWNERSNLMMEGVLGLKPENRDKLLDQLNVTLQFYKDMKDTKAQVEWSNILQKEAENILSKMSDTQFADWKRRIVQMGIDGVLTATEKFGTLIFSNKESATQRALLRAMAFTIRQGRDLTSPVVFKKAVLDRVHAETMEELNRMGHKIDKTTVENFEKTTKKMKGQESLDPRLTAQFKREYQDFSTMAQVFIAENVSVTHTLVMREWTKYHGAEGSNYQPESNLKVKISQKLSNLVEKVGGINFLPPGADLLRTIQYYSPFGILLPDVIRTKDGKIVTPQSAWEVEGTWRDNPVLARTLQRAMLAGGVVSATMLATALEFGGRIVTKAGLRMIPIFGKMLSRKINLTPLLAKGPLRFLKKTALWKVWAAIEGGDYLNAWLKEKWYQSLEGRLKAFKEKQAKDPASVTDAEKKALRRDALQKLVDKFRSPFQQIGYDLDKLDKTVGGLHFTYNPFGKEKRGGPLGDMFTEGKLLLAVITANHLLRQNGLEPFPIVQLIKEMKKYAQEKEKGKKLVSY